MASAVKMSQPTLAESQTSQNNLLGMAMLMSEEKW
jgi:hypothetical protein